MMNKEINTAKLAEMVRSKRSSKGLRETAKEIGGVSAPTLSRIEQGKIPDLDTYMKICNWLNVSSDFFTEISPSTSSSEDIVIAHLRADRTLSPDTAEALIKMINLAYHQTSSTK